MSKYKSGCWLTLFIMCIVLSVSSCRRQPGASVKVQVTADEQGYLFSENGQKALFFQIADKSQNGNYIRCNYVHPLYGLDGEILTEDFPQDHLHHHGIFQAWHQVWIGDKPVGDAWLGKDFRWKMQNRELLPPEGDSRTLKTTVLWLSPLWKDLQGDEKPFVKQVTFVTVYAARNNYRQIDFEIRLYALEPDIRIGGSDDEKGYGGFSMRFVLPADTRFRGENGPVVPQNTAVDAGPWVDVTGTFSNGRLAGIATLCHAGNPNYPQPWILRQTKSMQNVVYPGRQPAPLLMGKPLILRYRLIVHRGGVEGVPIRQILQEYSEKQKIFPDQG